MAKRRLDIIVKGEDRNATRLFKSLDRQMAILSGRVKTLAIGFGAFLGGRALIRGLKETTREVDKLAKQAEKLGTTTDVLSGLGFVAGQTGVELNKMTMAVQRMTRRMAEASEDGGEAKNTIADLGLDAEKLIALDLDEKLMVLAEAFGEVDNAGIKLARAFKLFDSEGADMVRVLNLGAAGIKGMMDQARALGIVIDQDFADKVVDANDALDRMGRLFEGLQLMVVSGLAPILQNFANGLIMIFSAVEVAIANLPKVMEIAILSAQHQYHKMRAWMASSLVKSFGFGALVPEPVRYKLDSTDTEPEPFPNSGGAPHRAAMKELDAKMDAIFFDLGKQIQDLAFERMDLGDVFNFGNLSKWNIPDLSDDNLQAPDGSGGGRKGRTGPRGSGPFGIGVNAQNTRFLTGASAFLHQADPVVDAAKKASAQRKRNNEAQFKQIEIMERINGTLELMRGDQTQTVTF
tara:strand:+ start:10211 stop:11599 length:1389 start_codon:yes stop_codon:yes gene_type:complete